MVKIITFFNNKGGVGKTTLIYHTAWMFAEMDSRVLVVDLDPQCNLSSMFLTDERLENVIGDNRSTILSAITPVVKGMGDFQKVHIEHIHDKISLIIGNLELSAFEDKLSDNWTKCLNRDEYAFRVVSVFYRIIKDAAERTKSQYVLIDVGPNLGAINRSTLIATDYVVIPVASDLFSLQGIKNLGSSFSNWRAEWKDRYDRNPAPDLLLPEGKMQPVGYVVMQHGVKESRPVLSYLKWANRIPETYQKYILKNLEKQIPGVEKDENCLGLIKHYRSLMPMAMEVRKPIFLLKPADGAIGAHFQAVQNSYKDLKELTEKIIQVCKA
ncbi:AAA family ATPase [candidate division KSB1 bacterium]|nr:AAA family ATPase [candidate division KSB1 bacterium]